MSSKQRLTIPALVITARKTCLTGIVSMMACKSLRQRLLLHTSEQKRLPIIAQVYCLQFGDRMMAKINIVTIWSMAVDKTN